MRLFRLTFCASAAFLLWASPARAQKPSAEGAWHACRTWVTRQLYEPAGLHFPALKSALVEVETTGPPMRPHYRIRSLAILPGKESAPERIPFSCSVRFGVTTIDGPVGYVYRHLVLPDSSVVLPRPERQAWNRRSTACLARPESRISGGQASDPCTSAGTTGGSGAR